MGRGKIEIKRIENSSNRQVTYTKRRNGIIKKAKEITVLCDAKVSLIIVSSSGKMTNYCSESSSLTEILDKYHSLSGKKLWDVKHENLSNEVDKVKKDNDNMQVHLRHLKGEDITSLNIKELIDLEEGLENGLVSIRDEQSKYVERVRGSFKSTEDLNNRLNYELEMKMDENVRDMENLRMAGNYNLNAQQMPFGFRVQPIQPNLQDRM